MKTPAPRNQVALVTGGSSGIGLAIAQTLVDAGMRVVVVGRSRTRLRAAAGQLLAGAQGGSGERGATSRVLAVTADVSKPGDV
ncbi:MAG: SDR family NAD(P)-dependent oxidoreductase, partial [Candidatus Methylomirabilaceae bacterium]